MAKGRTVYVCQSCAGHHPQWHGRCFECGEWETLVEEPVVPTTDTKSAAARSDSGLAGRLSEIDAHPNPRIWSGAAELDRVLGGGFVPGSVVLLGGDPGIGKSTFALQVAGGPPRGLAFSM